MKTQHAIALPILLVTAVALSGCTAINDQLHHESSTSFASASDLSADWGKQARWVPADATDIQIHESTAGDAAILLATTPSELDPALCVETDRQSGPVFGADWAPTDVYVEKAFVCGTWDVIPTKDGWFGWTPNDPDEEALSPQQ